MEQAIKKAIEGGWDYPKNSEFEKQRNYHRVNVVRADKLWTKIELDKTTIVEGENGEDKIVPITETLHTSDILFDPLFWHSLYGKENGRIKALEFINHTFDGKTIDQFFEHLSDMG